MNRSKILFFVEQAALALRAGRVVSIKSKNKELCIISSQTFRKTKTLKPKELVITSVRANAIIKQKKSKGNFVLNFDNVVQREIKQIIAENNITPDKKIIKRLKLAELNKSPIYSAAIKLSKIAEILPSVIVIESSKSDVQINSEHIDIYDSEVADNLVPIVTAPLTLQNAKSAEMTIFRASGGTKEHFAIKIGKVTKNKIPTVRIHSACFTGDVLASLKCDCREQLQSSIKIMEEEGGGILLYMNQDGRGIGLANKLRTYSLQSEGMDTVDANRYIGFDDDERLFLPAAAMLKKMGFKKVKILTNNPRKIAGLEKCGIKVVKRLDHMGACNAHNRQYLNTKLSKLGHIK